MSMESGMPSRMASPCAPKTQYTPQMAQIPNIRGTKKTPDPDLDLE